MAVRKPRKISMTAVRILIAIPICSVALSIVFSATSVVHRIQDDKTLLAEYTFRSSPNTIHASLKGTTKESKNYDSIEELRQRLPPSVWTVAGKNSEPEIARKVLEQLTPEEKSKSMYLCGKFLYSSLKRAVRVGDLGEQTFVATGDIDDMWTRDSAVQIGLYVGRMKQSPWLRLIIEGAMRRQAFNIIQDPYANAYERSWVDPSTLKLKDRVIGRGGWVATRNYELDSGAYFLTQLWDYYVAEGVYGPEKVLDDPMIFDAVMLMVDTWIVEQHHDNKSPYRYFELPNEGLGKPTNYTGMSWTGFRPSDDPCEYGYLIPANIHAAAGLERVLELNRRIWHSSELNDKATKLLKDIEDGIEKFGIVKTNKGEKIYAYEVDGIGNVLKDFDDANVPSLLSIPLLGWSKYNREVYRATRKRLTDPTINKQYFAGKELIGQGSSHTSKTYVWPMAFTIEALTAEGTKEELAKVMLFQLRQQLKAACFEAAHEGVHSESGCPAFTREWFEWSNALFVTLVESATGQRCDAEGQMIEIKEAANIPQETSPRFYQNKFHNDHQAPQFYQGIQAQIPHYE